MILCQVSLRVAAPSTLIRAKSDVALTIAAAVEHIVMIDVALSYWTFLEYFLVFTLRMKYRTRAEQIAVYSTSLYWPVAHGCVSAKRIDGLRDRDTKKKKVSGDKNSERAEESSAVKRGKKHKCVKDDTSSFSRVPFFFSLYYLSFVVDEVCVRGGQATIMNFSLCLIIIIIIIIITSSLLILLLLLLLYYVRLDTGFTILRNVHVLWVRAPLSKKKKTVPQASTFLPVPETDISPSILSHGIFRFTSPAPSRRTAITLRFWKRFYSPASVFAHGGEDGFLFRGTPRFRPPSWLSSRKNDSS